MNTGKICDLQDHRPPAAAFDTPLVCGQCHGEIPLSAALTFEGSDYVRYFCGEDCVAAWCESARETGLRREAVRIAFLLSRDGVQVTIDWVKRTLAIYRRADVNPGHFASDPAHERLFRISCADFARWLALQGHFEDHRSCSDPTFAQGSSTY